MATILLKHLAQLYTGFTIRESIEYLDYGEVKAIQIKDLPKKTHHIDTQILTGIEWRYDSKPQFLPHHALLLLARGEPTAYLFDGQASDKVVASNPFIVIIPQTDKLLPEYLLWYMNHAQTAKNHFASFIRGNAFAITTLTTVKELPISIPTLAEQADIVWRHQQAILEAQRFERLIALRQAYNLALAEQILNPLTDIKESS